MRRSRWSAMTCARIRGGNPLASGLTDRDENRVACARLALGRMARAAAAPGVRSDSPWRCHPPGRHRPPPGHDRSEHLRPVPRTHQPLGRGRSLRRADPRRRLRGPRLRDLLDALWTAGRRARRRGAVRAWHEERADHRRPPAVGNQASGASFLESGRSYDGSVWIKIESGAPRMSLRVLAADGSVLADLPLPARGSAWQEVPFSFASARSDRDAAVEIAAAGRGAALVDFVSLMRADVRKSGMLRPDLLAALRGLAPAFIRWPGGSFASTYKWQDGIGPFASRVYHPNEIWGGYSDYYGFGTDEYLELTRQLGADPLIVLPAPDDTPASVEYAMNWVHYVNDPPTTTWGQMRARNGHPEPVRRPLLPDRQRADEQRLHARALRGHRQSLRKPAAADRARCRDHRLRPEAVERHGVERESDRPRREQLRRARRAQLRVRKRSLRVRRAAHPRLSREAARLRARVGAPRHQARRARMEPEPDLRLARRPARRRQPDPVRVADPGIDDDGAGAADAEHDRRPDVDGIHLSRSRLVVPRRRLRGRKTVPRALRRDVSRIDVGHVPRHRRPRDLLQPTSPR